MPYSSGIQIINDTNGASYAFLSDNGLIWQCEWNSQAVRWDKGQVVPGAEGGEDLAVLYVDNLWPNGQTGDAGQGSSTNSGLVLAYRVGEGSGTEIHASFGSWDSQGQLNWSAPASLTNDNAKDQAFALMLNAQQESNNQGGGFSLVTQKQEGSRLPTEALDQAAALSGQNLEETIQAISSGTRPDTDLYRTNYSIERVVQGTSTQYNLQEIPPPSTSPSTTPPSPTPLQSIDQFTATQPASQPRPFAGNTELNRAQVLSRITQTNSNDTKSLLEYPSSTSAKALTYNDQSTSSAPSRGWSGAAWSVGKTGNSGTLSAGISKFPVRWRFVNGYQKEKPQIDPAKQLKDKWDNDDNNYYEQMTDLGSISFIDSEDLDESVRNASIVSFPETWLTNNPILEGAEDVISVEKIDPIDSEANALNPQTITPVKTQGTRKGNNANGWEINNSEQRFVWSGMFGGTNIGQGGTTVYNSAKYQYIPAQKYNSNYYLWELNSRQGTSQDNSQQRLMNSTPTDDPANKIDNRGTYQRITVGGTVRSDYQYSGSAFNPSTSLNSYTTQESVGLGYLYEDKKRYKNGSQVEFKLNVNGGLIFQQQYIPTSSEPLPEWLSISGDVLNYEATLFTALSAPNVFLNKGILLSDSPGVVPTYVSPKYSPKARVVTNFVVDFTNGFLIPAVTDVTLGIEYKSIESGGIGVFGEVGIAPKYLSKYGVGVEGMAASQTSYFFAGSDKGETQEIVYASAGLAALFGIYVPLLSYTYNHQSGQNPEASSEASYQSDPNSSDLDSLQSVALTSQDFQSSSTNVSSGTYSQAETGAAYPFLYNPDYASTISAAPQATLLGGNRSNLYAFTLFERASTSSDIPAEKITIQTAGSGLKPTSNPVIVDILGPFLDANDPSNRAQAEITINSDGELSSAKIINTGHYSYLLETGSNSGNYFLPLDLNSAGLIADPATSQSPLISIGATYASKSLGLAATPVMRIPTVRIAATTDNTTSSNNDNFPIYNAQANTTTPANPGNLKTYSYLGVPLKVNSSSGDPLQLLNDNLTARAYFSNGQLIALEPEQSIYFSNSEDSTDGYKLILDFTSFGESLNNSDLASLGTTTLTIPKAEKFAYNNVVSESQFSAQVGVINAGATNAGVYLSDGLSERIPLFPEMGNQAVFNRVVYNNGNNIAYLNILNDATNGEFTDPTLIDQAINNGESLPTFSAAMSPVAVTLASPPSGSNNSNIFGGDTFVAWVEASQPVVPLTSDDGEQNFQAYMQALYGNQRINYRINQGNDTNDTGWASMQDLDELYQPDNAVITQLRAFNAHNPNSNNPDDQITLLAWVETPLPGITDQSARLKVAAINPAAPDIKWNSLTKDPEGNSTIQSIPWDASRAAALTIDDLSIASLPLETPSGVTDTPVLSFSRDVRTPYRQSVLEDEPTLYLALNNLQSGINSINLGTTGESATQTFASDTGLNLNIASALPLSQGTAVQNDNGTGVLINGLGSFNSAVIDQFNQIAPDPESNSTSPIKSFTGNITGTTLTVTNPATESLNLGDVITGAGLRPDTTISAVVDANAGTFTLNQSVAAAITDGSFKAYPETSGLPYTTLEASIDSTTLTVSNLNGNLKVGDRLGGAGILPGTTITAANSDGSYTVNFDQNAGSSTAPIAAISSPGAGNSPYTLEFWAQLQPDSNPDGAGLVALGQPSEQAVGSVDLPEGWLMTSSFVVDRISYQQAASRGMIESIPSTVSNANDLYAWAWAVVADGANTTAMNGTGGNNLYSNALRINNLAAGKSNQGVTAFLRANGLESQDLIGRGGSAADVMVAVPTSQLEFAHFIDPNTNAPQSNLNTVALDTRSTSLNEGVVLMADANSGDATTETINTLFDQLWQFQKKTGEAKVNFSLAPLTYRLMQEVSSTYAISADDIQPLLDNPSQLAALIADNANTSLTKEEAQTWLTQKEDELKQADGTAANRYSIDQFSGYELGFSLSSGPAVSINPEGELVFDVGVGERVLSTDQVDLRDGEWHYIAASFLPNTVNYVTNSNSLIETYSNVGIASLYVDNELVGQDETVVDAFLPTNVNDELVMLTNNVGGAIDQLAIYNNALSNFTPPPASSEWPMPNSELALALLRDAGMEIDGKTPDPGAIPGAVTAHWDARDVNPNDAELNTFYSIYDTTNSSWSTPTTLDPQLAATPTLPSFASGSSIQDLWSLNLEPSQWAKNDWNITGKGDQSTSTSFNPSGLTLQAVEVSIPSTGSTQSLTADQVLIGDTTLAQLQPLRTTNNLNYTFLTNTPELTFLLDPADNSVIEKATVDISFTNGTTVSNTTPVQLTRTGTAVNNLADSKKALGSSAVIEQAPLQLKYIDSGEVIQRQSNDQGFGTSQAAGAFKTPTSTGTGTYSGWLAIAQPFTRAAVSNPAGRIWVQYTGDFTTTTGNSSGTRTAVSEPAKAPSTWLNALAQADFSDGRPTLPLLNSGFYPSSSGGLLIQADPTVGWGDQLGQTMLSADVTGSGTDDLVIAAPQANGGGLVYIIDGAWIEDNLTTANGATTLNLANPDDLGDYVLVLTPDVAKNSNGEPNSNDQASVAGFGSSLAFDTSTSTLWIGAPNYLRQLKPSDPSFASEQSIGALYSFNAQDDSTNWSSAAPKPLTPQMVGKGGTTTTLGADGSPTTTYWGSLFGSAIATDSSSGQLAVSAPGLQAGMLYSGSEAARETYIDGKRNASSADGDGALVGIQLPDTNLKIDVSQGTNSNFTPIIAQGSDPSAADTIYMKNLKDRQTDSIAGATIYNNQAVQAEAVGAVYLYSNQNDLSTADKTYYGPNPWNILGDAGFGKSLAFIDLNNTNSQQLAIGANATGGPGAVYVIDTNQDGSSNGLSSPDLDDGQQLAHLAAGLTLFGAEAQDQFGNGVVNLGDVNSDGYQDLLIQAMNASNGAGTGSVLFGSDQFSDLGTNPATGTVASGSIGLFQTVSPNPNTELSSFSSAILQEFGYGQGFTGSGTYGTGDINADGIDDIQLGSAQNNNAYLTWGHPYLEAVNTLALDKLASNTGYMLDGLATTTAGSLRSIGDFNGDGYGDFISIQPGDSVNNVRLELGANTQEILADYLYNHYNFTVTPDTQVLPAGDINGDGLADIALFLNDNVSSTADGNQGAGSTTGILYGRSSDQLPIGSGFGLLSPVNPDTNAPLLSLPSQSISGGLSNASPAVIAVGSNLYATVKGNSDNTIWFASSSDGGSSWSTWNNLTSSNPAFATTTAPSLAFFDQKLQMSFVDTSGALQISSFNPASTSLSDWSTPASIATTQPSDTGFDSSFSPALVDQGDALAVVWLDSSAGASSGTLYSAVSTSPDKTTTTYVSPSPWSGVDGGSSPASPALAQLNDTLYMAVQGNGDSNIYWSSSTDNGSVWADWQALPSNLTSNNPPSLAVYDETLYLSYIGTDQQEIVLTTLDTSTNSWSEVYRVLYSGGQQSALQASLVTETINGSDQLVLYYISDDDNQSWLLRSAGTPADSTWSDPVALEYNDDSGNQTASGPLAVSSKNGQTVIAYQGGTVSAPSDAIYLTTSSTPNNSSSWSLQSPINPDQQTGLGLTHIGDELLLSYSNSTSPDALQLQQFSNDNNTWSETQATSTPLISSGSNLVSILNSSGSDLLLAGIDTSSNDIDVSFAESSTSNTSWTAPSQLLERSENAGTVTFTPITATAAPAATMLGANPVVAVNNNANIDVYSPSESGSSLTLTSSFSASGSDPVINPSTAPSLTTTDTGLALTYTNSDQSVNVERLDFFNLAGDAANGVKVSADGYISNDSNLQWQSTTLDSSNGGINTSLATASVVVDGNLLLTSIDSTSDQVRINAIPALSDPDSTTWINSTIQLPDGNKGLLISQTDANAPSTLTALGDLDGDGNDDLIVTNPSLTVDAISAPSAWSGVDGGSSPASPALAQLNDTLYMAVQGNGDSNIYWSSSTDNGSVWADWQALPSNLTSNNPPSLAVYDETLYLSYIGTDQQEIVLTTLDTSTNSWSEVYRVLYSGGQQSALQASLVTETINGSDQLVLYYISDDDNQSWLLRSAGTPADSTWSDPVALEYNDDSGNQTASGPLAVSSKNGQTVIAYQGGTVSAPSDAIYLTTSSTPNNSSSWSLQSPINPDQQTGLGLTHIGDELLLSYSNSTSPDALQLQQFSNDNNTWSETQATSTPLISSGSNLVSILNSSAATAETILFAGVDAGSKDIDVKVASTNTQNSGLRLINGAPTPEQMASLNNATAQSQSVQLAPVPPSNAVGITASLTGNHFLSLTAANSNTTSDLEATPIQPGNVLATAGALESAQKLYAEAIATGSGAWSSNDASPLTGSPAINTTTSFGDLNGDGYQDYLSAIPEQVYGHDGYTWNVWSIRATGDVNGNGKDDVLLALAPVTPTTITIEPNFLQTVQIDGELFKVSLNDNDDFGTFSLTPEGLKRPLNPYSFAETYDNKSTESYEYVPLLQNWLKPILSYVPPKLTNASLSNPTNPANAEAYEIPATVANENTIYTAFKGESGSTLWVASQDINDESPAIQTPIPNGFVPGRDYAAVAAALFKDKNTGKDNLFVVTTDKDGNLYITGGDPSDVGGWQLNEQIKTSNNTNPESTPVGAQIALLTEGDRLALYFTSNDKSYAPRYLYSTDPITSGTWGSSFDAASKSFTGSSVAINTDKSNGGIVATVFQNKTVLIYNNEEDTTILSAQRFQPTGSQDWFSSTQDYNLYPNSLTTDQTQLYLTGEYGELTTFKPSLGLGQWEENGQTTIDSNYAYAFLANGQLKAAAPPNGKNKGDLYISDLDLTTESSTIQKSLAGYSIDGNIDVNGDGFADMLVSDPSDPSLDVNNQYVLFGGDYLNIASQVGTNGPDTLVGTPLADVIYTIAGDDNVISKGGRDVIYTGSGADSISITGNTFSRIDGGSGIDQLFLEGDANQSYDFRLDVPTPEYFIGTKLKNIEAISSKNYGANTLSFDSKAIRDLNDQRMVFLTPDSSDTINLFSDSDYSFSRNQNLDTNLGGDIWNAFAASLIASSDTPDSSTLVYVLNPDAGEESWLSSHVSTNPTDPSTVGTAQQFQQPESAELQTFSAIEMKQSFGEGLTLSAYKSKSTDHVSRFTLTRNITDSRQVVAYSSSSTNSTAKPGLHYTPVAGVVILEPGEALKSITIPLKDEIKYLRSSQISLQVEEIPDHNQQSNHLMIDLTNGLTDTSVQGQVLSSFQLDPSQKGSSALLSLRTDVNTETSDLKLSISQRDQADAKTATQVKEIQIKDYESSDKVKSINTAYLDADQQSNKQVGVRLKLNLDSNSSESRVELLGPDLPSLTPFTLATPTSFSLSQETPLGVWRSDTNSGSIDLALRSGSDDILSISSDFAPAMDGAIDASVMSADDWKSTEGKAIGSYTPLDSGDLTGQDWTPVAQLDGEELDLISLTIDEGVKIAKFSKEVVVNFNLHLTPKTPTAAPLKPEVTIHRLAGYDNHLAFYKTDDLTGTINGLAPNDSNYLDTALNWAKENNLYLDAEQLPAYKQSRTFTDLELNSNDHYGLLLIVDGSHETIYSSFSEANPQSAMQMIALNNPDQPNVNTIGIEDLLYNGDNDFNDLIVEINTQSTLGIF